MNTSTELRWSTQRAPAGGAVWTALLHLVGWPGRVYRARRLLTQLGGFADHELRDIGLNRLDLAAARAMPLDADPSLTLRRCAEERRRRR